MTDLAAPPLMLDTGDEFGKQGDEEMKQGEGAGESTAVTSQQPGAMTRFSLRAPVQIRMDVHEDKEKININAELPGMYW